MASSSERSTSTSQILAGRWKSSKSHFLQMYDSSLRALDKLTLHQRERLNDIKCLDMFTCRLRPAQGRPSWRSSEWSML